MSSTEESLARWCSTASLKPTWHAQPSNRVRDDLDKEGEGDGQLPCMHTYTCMYTVYLWYLHINLYVPG